MAVPAFGEWENKDAKSLDYSFVFSNARNNKRNPCNLNQDGEGKSHNNTGTLVHKPPKFNAWKGFTITISLRSPARKKENKRRRHASHGRMRMGLERYFGCFGGSTKTAA